MVSEDKIIEKAVGLVQYVLSYGLNMDVTEEEIERCEELMGVLLKTSDWRMGI